MRAIKVNQRNNDIQEINPEAFEPELPTKIEVENKDEIEKTVKEYKQTKMKMEFSKKITIASITLAWCFIAFVCYEMHRLCDLSAVAWIGTGIVIMIAICVRSYMKRAYQNDLVWMRVNQSREMSKLKQEFGDDFIMTEQLMDVNIDGNQ